MYCRKSFLMLLLLHVASAEVDSLAENRKYDNEVEVLEHLKIFFFIFSGLAVGGAIRALIKFFNCPIPYRVALLLFGCVVGAVSRTVPMVKDYTRIAYMHPHYMLMAFIPVIIFKTAFCIDCHTFLRSWNQMFFLSVPGIIISSCFTGLIMMMIFEQGTIATGILFGTISSAIYPAETVLMLKEVSQAKHLSTLLEGEAVLGEGTVMILYEILTGVIGQAISTWYHVLMVFCRFALGGILWGLISGRSLAWIVGIMYADPGSTSIVTLVAAYLVYYIAEEMLYVSGVVTLVIMGILAGMGRTSLSIEVETFLFHFWDMLAYVANTMVFLMVGVIITEELVDKVGLRDCALVLVTYVVVTISRLLNYIFMAPIVSRISYGLTIRNMTVAVWGGLKGPLSFCLALMVYRTDGLEEIGCNLLIHVVGLVVLTLLINAPTVPLFLRLLGLSEMPLARKVNMNNCMRFIQNRRDRAIAMLKMDRFLADANWPLVNSTTVLKHPYRINLTESDDEDDDYYMGYRTTRCPDCLREVLNEPTSREVAEMTREARLRILKAKKISYTRQYENGMLSKEGIRILTQAVEVAMDTPQALVELDGLHKYFQRQGFVHYTRRKLLTVFFKKAETDIKPPRKYWRRICYHIIVHPAFDYFIYLCILFNVIPISLEIALSPKSDGKLSMSIKIANTFFFIIYFLEFVLKIYGYSWIYVCQDGFRTYFKSYWNIFDFVIICAALVDLIMDYMDLFILSFNKGESNASKITLFTRLVRIIRLLRMLRLCKAWYPRLIKYCDSKIDKHLAFAYDVGKGFVTGEEEVSDMLIQMIDNKDIREECRLCMEADRLAVTKELGLVQKDRPWIAITVKTRQAIRAILNSMGDGIMELKVSGWVDDVEYAKLMESLEERLKYVRRKVKSVQPSPPRVLFKEVPWLAEDEQIADYLYENVMTKIFDEGEVVCNDGEMAEGIYIIVTGLFKLTYTPKHETLTRLIELGALPVLDYISSTRFDEKLQDYIVSGNTVGELSFLTGRPYDCKIIADTSSQAYILTHQVLKEAIQRNSDSINGLECRIWKYITVRLATTILMDTPAYQSTAQSKIHIILERAFVPNLSKYKIFGVNDMMQDIILLDGVVVDYNTRECYIAPCHIPRTVQKILLPKSSQMNFDTTIETKLLIIPAKDVDEFDIMEREEDISEMISTASSRCLQHVVRNRASKLRRRKKRQTMFGMTRRRIKYDSSKYSSTQSMYTSRSHTTTPSLAGDETELRNIRMSEHDATFSSDVYIANEKENSRRPTIDYHRTSKVNRDRSLPINVVKRPLEDYLSDHRRSIKNLDAEDEQGRRNTSRLQVAVTQRHSENKNRFKTDRETQHRKISADAKSYTKKESATEKQKLPKENAVTSKISKDVAGPSGLRSSQQNEMVISERKASNVSKSVHKTLSVEKKNERGDSLKQQRISRTSEGKHSVKSGDVHKSEEPKETEKKNVFQDEDEEKEIISDITYSPVDSSFEKQTKTYPNASPDSDRKSSNGRTSNENKGRRRRRSSRAESITRDNASNAQQIKHEPPIESEENNKQQQNEEENTPIRQQKRPSAVSEMFNIVNIKSDKPSRSSRVSERKPSEIKETSRGNTQNHTGSFSDISSSLTLLEAGASNARERIKSATGESVLNRIRKSVERYSLERQELIDKVSDIKRFFNEESDNRKLHSSPKIDDLSKQRQSGSSRVGYRNDVEKGNLKLTDGPSSASQKEIIKKIRALEEVSNDYSEANMEENDRNDENTKDDDTEEEN